MEVESGFEDMTLTDFFLKCQETVVNYYIVYGKDLDPNYFSYSFDPSKNPKRKAAFEKEEGARVILRSDFEILCQGALILRTVMDLPEFQAMRVSEALSCEDAMVKDSVGACLDQIKKFVVDEELVEKERQPMTINFPDKEDLSGFEELFTLMGENITSFMPGLFVSKELTKISRSLTNFLPTCTTLQFNNLCINREFAIYLLVNGFRVRAKRVAFDRLIIAYVVELGLQNGIDTDFLDFSFIVPLDSNADGVFKVLQSHMHVKKICLAYNYFNEQGDGQSFGKFFKMMPQFKELKELHIGPCLLKTTGSKALGEFLSQNPPLEVLNLWCCFMDDDATEAVFRSLQGNSNLKRLNICYNIFTDRAVAMIQEYLKTTQSLEELVLYSEGCKLDWATPEFPTKVKLCTKDDEVWESDWLRTDPNLRVWD